VPEALVKLGRELGVKYRTSVEVEKLLIDNQKVFGLMTTAGETLLFDAVVSNEDAVRTYRELVGGSLRGALRRSGSMSQRVQGWCSILG